MPNTNAAAKWIQTHVNATLKSVYKIIAMEEGDMRWNLH
mgnify:CR=1 FL=1